MSVRVEYLTTASEKSDGEENNASNDRVSPELEQLEEGITANMEPLNEQISTLTQLLNQLIHDNSAKSTPTARSCAHRPHKRRPLDRETGAPRTSPDKNVTIKRIPKTSLNSKIIF